MELILKVFFLVFLSALSENCQGSCFFFQTVVYFMKGCCGRTVAQFYTSQMCSVLIFSSVVDFQFSL